MTAVLERKPVVAGGGARAMRERRPAPAPAPPRSAVAGAAMTVLAFLLLSFVAEVTVVGAVRHARAQELAYEELRFALAEGTAPVGQRDVYDELVPPGEPIALLSIPKVDLREVVFEGTAGHVLTSGPGHRRDTPYPGQAGGSQIYGRMGGYGAPFLRLDELKPGDEIAVTTGQGSHLYEVTAIRGPGSPVTPLEAGAGRLTLVSATGWIFLPEEVLRVDATLVSEVHPSPSMSFTSDSLPESEEAMASDSTVGLPLLLWSQLLLLAAVGLAWMRAVWGRWQSWIVAVPVLTFLCLQVSHQAAQLLPNLL